MDKKVPFPQANNMELIYIILKNFDENGMTKFMLKDIYGLTVREGAYYLDALHYIDLVEKHRIKYFLNQNGVIVKDSSNEKQKKSFAQMVQRNDFVNRMSQKVKAINNNREKQDFIANCIMFEIGLSDTTAQRRASTILSWLNWLKNNL